MKSRCRKQTLNVLAMNVSPPHKAAFRRPWFNIGIGEGSNFQSFTKERDDVLDGFHGWLAISLN